LEPYGKEGQAAFESDGLFRPLKYTPKINIEPENDRLEDVFPFSGVYSQVPCQSSWVYLELQSPAVLEKWMDVWRFFEPCFFISKGLVHHHPIETTYSEMDVSGSRYKQIGSST